MTLHAAVIDHNRLALVDAMLAPIEGATIGDEVFAASLVDGVVRSARGGTPRDAAAVYVSSARVPHRLAHAFAELARDLNAGSVADARAVVDQVLAQLAWRAGEPEALAPPDPLDAAVEQRVAHLERVDKLSGEHSRAVGAWCGRIAERLGLDTTMRLHVVRSGLLHDVGKALVPAAILRAPRALEAEERALVEAHVLFGEQTVLEDPALRELAAAARSHHERFDGRGYPDGLAGQGIPLAARIVGVADAFDAMIDRRPYRAARAPSAALQELHRERGAQFDPEIVDAMIAVVEAL